MQGAELSKTPELRSAIDTIQGNLKYYTELNAQLIVIGHKLHDTNVPKEEIGKSSPPLPNGLLGDLKGIGEWIAVQNTILQDTINKLTGLI